jgi:hypothetical protein
MRDRRCSHDSSNGRRAATVLIVEPLAGFVARWWNAEAAVQRRGWPGGRWRFRVELPPIVAKLDRAAGLDHREAGRSLYLRAGLQAQGLHGSLAVVQAGLP